MSVSDHYSVDFLGKGGECFNLNHSLGCLLYCINIIRLLDRVYHFSLLICYPCSSSFCISSTYDTLPSPSNLKRWKLTTEASCFLCNKDTCTTSHILGACKVALSQGRFTFRHDNVLRVIISNIRSSVKNIKSSVPTSKQPIKIKFVEKGTRVKNKNWVLLGDQMALFPFYLM